MHAMHRIRWLLFSLALFDCGLFTVGFFAPSLWFAIFHGAPYIDPQALLPRTAAAWAAFALLQTIAAFKWKERPEWLLVVAGVRLSDMFTDWTYLALCHDVTWFGRLSLAAVSPANLVIGLYLWRAYFRLQASK